MTDPQIEALQESILNLIPGSNVAWKILSCEEFASIYAHRKENLDHPSGVFPERGKVTLWFDLPNSKRAVIEVFRELVPLTRSERSVFKSFPNSMNGLLVDDQITNSAVSTRIATRYAFEQVLISRFVRGYNSNSVYTTSLILNQLQKLCIERYEGHKCTSGVVFTSEPNEYLARLDNDEYQASLLPSEIAFDEEFFSNPASYRYIDGRNSFILVDNFRRVIASLRCVQPGNYSYSDRVSNKHLSSLLVPNAGRVWIGYIGENDDVNVVLRNHLQLRWLKSHWRIIDRRILAQIICDHGVDEQEVELLIDTIFAISNLRRGALILFPDDIKNLPQIAGTIDQSGLSQGLIEATRGTRISELAKQNAAIGLFTTDGLTSIDKVGAIQGFGLIINISSSPEGGAAGGGRTQAAIEASQSGLVVKVSEDGPISVYKEGSVLFRLVF